MEDNYCCMCHTCASNFLDSNFNPAVNHKIFIFQTIAQNFITKLIFNVTINFMAGASKEITKIIFKLYRQTAQMKN